jgi:predicted amidohydrolase
MSRSRLAAAATIVLVLVLSSEAQDAGSRAASVATPPPISLKVAAVQFRSCRDLDRNVAGITAQIRRLAKEGVRVAAFPECALTGYFEDVVKATTAKRLADTERRIADACREAGIYAVVGTPYRDGGKLYNSATVIDPSGKIIERYHKIQLAESWSTPGRPPVRLPGRWRAVHDPHLP